MTGDTDNADLLQLTARIVIAHVTNNAVATSDLQGLIGSVYSSLSQIGSQLEAAQEQKPAVSVRASIKPDHLVCLEDGGKYKSLKRHLRSAHDLTPESYRAKWGLPTSYPMVAPSYTAIRKGLAVQHGLGRKPRADRAPASKPTKQTQAPKGRGRSKLGSADSEGTR